ncbi:MAG: DUF4430 domain-containing protein [Clostridia bacterium]|nr:DUF4430 domain-containing protein [Clostridia bacterium]
MKKYKKRIILGVLVLLALVAVCFWSGNCPEPAPVETVLDVVKTDKSSTSTESPKATEEPEREPSQEEPEKTESLVITQPPIPTEEALEPTGTPRCTLTVRCDDVFQNLENLAEGKETILPQNGILYPEQTVEFSQGESVFDVLCREMRKNNIHFEFVKTPMYNSVYIEGIGNLYEFDCGDTSGWMYRVNGEKPNYGCSQYLLKEGDHIVFYYSCSLS